MLDDPVFTTWSACVAADARLAEMGDRRVACACAFLDGLDSGPDDASLRRVVMPQRLATWCASDDGETASLREANGDIAWLLLARAVQDARSGAIATAQHRCEWLLVVAPHTADPQRMVPHAAWLNAWLLWRTDDLARAREAAEFAVSSYLTLAASERSLYVSLAQALFAQIWWDSGELVRARSALLAALGLVEQSLAGMPDATLERTWRNHLRVVRRGWVRQHAAIHELLEANSAEEAAQRAVRWATGDLIAAMPLMRARALRALARGDGGEAFRVAAVGDWVASLLKVERVFRHELGERAEAFRAWDVAEVVWRELATEPGSDPEVRGYWGRSLTRLGRMDEAESVLRDALTQAPESPDILTALGEICRLRGTVREARRWVDRALRFDPDNASAVDLRSKLARMSTVSLDGEESEGPGRAMLSTR